MAQQIKVNVYGLKGGKQQPVAYSPSDIFQDAFPANLKFSPDKLTGVPAVYSRIDYTEGDQQMSAYVTETITQLVALANA